jgi:hypothetical protein
MVSFGRAKKLLSSHLQFDNDYFAAKVPAIPWDTFNNMNNIMNGYLFFDRIDNK